LRDVRPCGVRLLGVDFTCVPSARKPITAAHGVREGAVLRLERIDELRSLAAFEALLGDTGPWFGAFDFPFGLPRVFVDELGLGASTREVIARLRERCGSRMALRALIDAWTNKRPAGLRLVHRRTDRTRFGVSSSSPLQSRYVPVAFMYYEGLHRLVAAGVTIPRLHRGRGDAKAVEGYPGLLAHELIGTRSYKNGDDTARRAARREIVDRLGRGEHRLGIALEATAAPCCASCRPPGRSRGAGMACRAMSTSSKAGSPRRDDETHGDENHSDETCGDEARARRSGRW
jgi:hypothetical protein